MNTYEQGFVDKRKEYAVDPQWLIKASGIPESKHDAGVGALMGGTATGLPMGIWSGRTAYQNPISSKYSKAANILLAALFGTGIGLGAGSIGAVGGGLAGAGIGAIRK